jgi:signal transduction histidine kinase
MSHELRTPLNAVLGFSQLLVSDELEPLTPNQQANAEEILNAGNHLLDLINEILDLSQIEAGKLYLQEESLDVNELLMDCLHLVENFAHQRKVTLNLHANTSTTIKADRIRLKQVLLNLLSNAIKYNQRGGSVEITCEQKDSQHLAIHVSDTGQGIDYPEMEKLFQPFERLNQMGNAEGTGIGLTISKHLVELMDGQISVNSTVGKGSTFSVQLPITRAA